MSNAPSGLAVVSTPLPLVDRRSLSQAWYSALHLAPHAREAVHVATLHNKTPELRVVSRNAPVGHVAATAVPRPEIDRARAGGGRVPTLAERRSAPPPLARKVVRALERRIPAEHPAGVALRTESGRIQILVRRDAGRLRLIALCSEDVRENVARAIAHASYALAGNRWTRC